MESKVVYGLSILLADPMLIYHNDLPFLKLSKGRILPNAADQAKKVTLKMALLLQEKEVLTWELRHYKLILHQTTLSWKGQQSLSSLPCLNLMEE
jgi:hypothetical protein